MLCGVAGIKINEKINYQPGLWTIDVVGGDTIIKGDQDAAIKSIIKNSVIQGDLLRATQEILSTVHADRSIPDTNKFNAAVAAYIGLINPKKP